MSLQVNAATDSHLDYQKGLSQMGDKKGKPLKEIRSEGRELLLSARKEANGISQQDYDFLKGTSAFAASGAEWAHLERITGQGVTILLLEDSGVNHADIRNKIEFGSPENAIKGMQYKLDHGSGMASLIHAIVPDSIIRVRPIRDLSTSLNSDVRIINASFGGKFKSSFIGINEASKVLIAKSAGNHQENLSEHTEMEGCEPLLPFTIFTGNLRQDYKGSTSSGFPGTKREFQNSFLWVIADDVLAASGPDGSTQYSPGTGTSNAAAILSGAAALILSKYPTLNTADLKEILLESTDRDIFQLFGSGYKALHISDNSVSFYRKQTQYKKTHKSTSILDFAEDLANSNDTILAAEIIGGSRGVSNRAPNSTEVEQFKRILKKIKESGNEKLLSLAPDTARTEPERKHREIIQQMLTADTSSSSATTQKKSHNYDPAFWGKGVLNIKNALIYAKLKMRYPTISAGELRERMLRFINTQQQVAAKKIQTTFSARQKPEESSLETRPSLTINTSLLGRTFTKMPTDPKELVVQDQSDEERLKGLDITLPEALAGKQLKVISGGASTSTTSSGPAREIAPIADSDIPGGASAKLREFLKADREALFKAFTAFGESEIIPLLDLSPEEAANKLIQLHQSLGEFRANRFINLGYDSDNSGYRNKKISSSITIIDLLHDAVRNQIAIDGRQYKYDRDTQKIAKIAIQLFKILNKEGLINRSLLSKILSILKDYNTESRNDFIIQNDLLSGQFTCIAPDYSGQYQFIGADILDWHGFKNVIDSKPSAEINEKIKSFFDTSIGVPYIGKISISYLSNAIYAIDAFWDKPEEEKERALQAIWDNIVTKAQDFSSFIKTYTLHNQNTVDSLYNAINSQQFDSLNQDQKKLLNQSTPHMLETIFR